MRKSGVLVDMFDDFVLIRRTVQSVLRRVPWLDVGIRCALSPATLENFVSQSEEGIARRVRRGFVRGVSAECAIVGRNRITCN